MRNNSHRYGGLFGLLLVILFACSQKTPDANVPSSARKMDEPDAVEPNPIAKDDEVDESPEELSLANFQWQYKGFAEDSEFEIDKNLNLTVAYRYRFAFKPIVTRQLSLGSFETLPLTSGSLRLTFVLLASGKGDSIQDHRYLTSSQINVKVSPQGQVVDEIVLKYPHVFFASGRQTLLLQMTPLDTQTPIKAQSFSGNLSSVDQETTSLIFRPDGRDASAIQANKSNERKLQLDQMPTALDRIRKDTKNFLMSDVSDFPEQAQVKPSLLSFLNYNWEKTILSKEELFIELAQGKLGRSVVEGKSEFSTRERLCLAYFSMAFRAGAPAPTFERENYLKTLKDSWGNIMSSRCNKRILDKYLKIEVFDFVETLYSIQPRNIDIITFSNMHFGVFYSKEHSTGSTSKMELSFGVKLEGLDLLSGLEGVSYSQSTFDTHSLSERRSFGVTQQMAIDQGSLEVDVGVKTCARLRSFPKLSHYAWSDDQKTWIICSPKIERKWVQIKFYYLSQIFNSVHSAFMDHFSGKAGVKVFVRDQFHFKAISDRLEKTDFSNKDFNVFVHAHVPDLTRFESNEVESLTDQDMPGAIQRE